MKKHALKALDAVEWVSPSIGHSQSEASLRKFEKIPARPWLVRKIAM